MEKPGNLDRLPAAGFSISSFPVKIKGASAGFSVSSRGWIWLEKEKGIPAQ